jgi:energy-coupling factor transporter ATP-binding protein EcfA2
MWLRKLELRHVRHIKELSLDLTGSLILIGGPIGVGKTTLQKAILAAMFQVKKDQRDQLRSCFDPDSPPQATLELSRSNSDTAIVLTRRLTDDAGEWREGATIIKKKGEALAKIQESLPISADAAASLLWGLQDSMTAVIDTFPSDGHSLLTAATIKGSGPDPKNMVEQLDKEFKNAKKGGKDPGPLTRAEQQAESLEKELEAASEAQKSVGKLNKDYDEAKMNRDQAQRRREETKNEIERLSNLETLLDAALKAEGNLSELATKQGIWDQLENDIRISERAVSDLELDLTAVQRQFRVANDKELGDKATRLALQIRAVEEAEKKRDGIQAQLDEKKRPDKNDREEYAQMKGRHREADATVRATGVRYRLVVESGSRTVEIREDQEPGKQVHLAPYAPHQGVVGNIEIVSDNLRVVASGKADIATHKSCREEAEAQIANLFNRFCVHAEDQFRLLGDEREKLEQNMQEAKRDLEKELKGSTLASLRSELALTEKARKENAVTQADLHASQGKHVPSSTELNTNLIGKTAEIEIAKKELQKLQRKRPTDAEKTQHDLVLKTARGKAEDSVLKFKESDEARREPTDEVLKEIRRDLKAKRDKFYSLVDPQKNPENEVMRLATELKYAGPERPIPSIESDLDEAKAILHRERLLQAGRELLKERIESKINEMTAEVPRELGSKISQHLASLTRGGYEKLMLAEDLTVKSIGENGGTKQHWEPRQLSHGERHVTALAIKIAVARSLADLTGPVFVVLDDSLVTFDPDHRERTEALLMDLVADGKLQVILLTCHTDWAVTWKKRAGDRLQYVELEKIAKYYRPPVAIVLPREANENALPVPPGTF